MTTEVRELYIDLLEKVLIDYHRSEHGEYRPLKWGGSGWRQKLLLPLAGILQAFDYRILKYSAPNMAKRVVGADWPVNADTMIGLKRLQNIRFCVEDTINNRIEGDLIETGVWRGGATIYMRALLKAFQITDKCVWVADSFEGLPRPNEKFVHDRGDEHYLQDVLSVSLETVKRNFEKYGLLDGQVKFLKGWFSETLPSAPIEKLSVLRLDGDMYESTMDALVHLYPKLSVGGYVIVDDWGAVKACREAVTDFRKTYGVADEMNTIDWAGVFWKKSHHA